MTFWLASRAVKYGKNSVHLNIFFLNSFSTIKVSYSTHTVLESTRNEKNIDSRIDMKFVDTQKLDWTLK